MMLITKKVVEILVIVVAVAILVLIFRFISKMVMKGFSKKDIVEQGEGV